MLSRLVIALLPRSKHLLVSWLQSLSAVILEPKKIWAILILKKDFLAIRNSNLTEHPTCYLVTLMGALGCCASCQVEHQAVPPRPILGEDEGPPPPAPHLPP